MERIKIFDKELPVKNYYCSDSPTKLRITKPSLRLYIKLTDQCLANCKFCANRQSKDFGTIDLEKLAFVISYLKEKNILHGISITGGEPMTNPDTLFQMLDLIYQIDEQMEVAISTNGYNCKEFKKYNKVNQLESIHISRHHYDDKKNQDIFDTNTIATTTDIMDLQQSLKDEKIININTMIMKSGINSLDEIKTMLTYVGDIGVYKTGFVSLMKCNPYAEREFINFNSIFENLDSNFFPGYHFYSQEYCECVDGIRLTEHNKLVEYYARMIKECDCPYTTQLVYTSDNKLTAGFGKKVLWK